MLTRFLSIPQMQTPFDTLFEQVQPDTTKILAAPFLVSDRISKRAQLFQRVFRKLSYVNQPGFLWRSSAIRIPAFSFSKRALPRSTLSSAVLLFWEDGFFRFLTLLFRARKRAPDFFQILVGHTTGFTFLDQSCPHLCAIFISHCQYICHLITPLCYFLKQLTLSYLSFWILSHI